MCDSDKEVEDIKTEENVENDEASTETEDCEKKDLPEEPQYEILDVEELQRNFREKVIDFFKVKSHIVVTSVSAAVIIAGVITGIVVGIHQDQRGVRVERGEQPVRACRPGG